MPTSLFRVWALIAAGCAVAAPRALARELGRPSPPVVRVAAQAAQGDAAKPPATPAPLAPKPPPETIAAPAPSGAALPKPGGMTLDQFEALAMNNNPSLAQFGAAVGTAQGNWLQVGLYPNPDIGYAGNQMNDRGTAGQQGAWFAQSFVTAHKLRLNRAAASQDVNRAQNDLMGQRLRVLTDVRLRYYDALVAQRSLEVTGTLLKISEQGVVAAEALLKAQEASRVDLLQAKIERDTALILQTRALNRQQAAWRALAAVCGLPDLQSTRLAGELTSGWPELNWDECLGRLWGASPELGAARAKAAQAGWVLARAQVEPVPNIDTQFSPQYDTNAQFANYTVLMSVKYPLWNKNQGNIRAAQADLMAARANVAKLELALQQRLAQAFERYANARQQSERYQRDIMPNAQTTLDLVTQGYRQGEFTYLFLLTAQRTFFQVNLAYIDSLREMWQGSMVIDGMLLSDSLSAGIDDTGGPNPGSGAAPGPGPTLSPALTR